MNNTTKQLMRQAGIIRVRENQYAGMSDEDVDVLIKLLVKDNIGVLKDLKIATKSLVAIEQALKERYGLE